MELLSNIIVYLVIYTVITTTFFIFPLIFILFFNLGAAIKGGRYSKAALSSTILFFIVMAGMLLFSNKLVFLSIFTAFSLGLFVLGLLSDPNKIVAENIREFKGSGKFKRHTTIVHQFAYTKGWERTLEKMVFLLLMLNPFSLILLFLIEVLPRISKSRFEKIKNRRELWSYVQGLLDKGATRAEIESKLKSMKTKYNLEQIVFGNFGE